MPAPNYPTRTIARIFADAKAFMIATQDASIKLMDT
jgi:hypothetical protein